MTRLSETHHLAWSCQFASAPIEALAVRNADRKQRMSWALDELFSVPSEGVPRKICDGIAGLRETFLANPAESIAPTNLIHRNLDNIRSWKKRDQICREILDLCVGILEAHAAFTGSTEYYSRHQ